jgi:type IV pilus assembly protein PilO
MIEYWDKLLDRPRWQKIAMWIGSLLMFSYLYWHFIFSSKLETYSKTKENLERIESQIGIETAKLRNLPTLRKELSEFKELNSKALEMLPKKGQVESLLDSVSELAEKSGLSVQTFIPRPEIKRQFYAEIPVDMEMKGSFHQVVTFLDELSREPRIVNVQDILIDNPRGYTGNSGVDIDVKAVLKTFRYLEPSERPQASKDTDKKSKKKAS